MHKWRLTERAALLIEFKWPSFIFWQNIGKAISKATRRKTLCEVYSFTFPSSYYYMIEDFGSLSKGEKKISFQIEQLLFASPCARFSRDLCLFCSYEFSVRNSLRHYSKFAIRASAVDNISRTDVTRYVINSAMERALFRPRFISIRISLLVSLVAATKLRSLA